MTLVDFCAPQEVSRWSAIDDAVMGGRSRSRIDFDAAGHAVFCGTVSLDNGGGFASVRRQPDALGAPAVAAFVLDVCGDGKRYKLNLRTDDGFDGINYQCAFAAPAGIWMACRLPCDRFVPTWRGRPAATAPALDPACLRQIGLLIGDRQEGSFSLAIRRIAIEPAYPQEEVRC